MSGRGSGSEVRFPAERLGRLPPLDRHHFWHSPRRYLLHRLIRGLHPGGRRLVDVGCGAGTMVDYLRRRGWDAVGVDPYARHVGLDRDIFVEGTCERLPLPSHSEPLIGLFDVLEHVDPTRGLAEVRRVLRADGRLVLTVPACPSLWSVRDEQAKHRCRYTRRSLRSLLAVNGFVVEDLFGYGAVLLPLLFVARRAARWLGPRRTAVVDLEDHPPVWLDPLLAVPNWCEALLSPWVRFPWGSSLVAVCRLAR